MFSLIEKKTSEMVKEKSKSKVGSTVQATSIVSDSIQRSVFGVFSQNYKLYKELPGKKDSMEIWKNFFIQSKILSDIQRSLLYFNLPFNDIIKEQVKPELLFEQDLKNGAAKGSNFLNEMLNKFEKVKDDKYRLANIILLQIPQSHDVSGNQAQGNKGDEIIGGYASDGWAASQELLGSGGDESCFLFNLTKNLRFNAIKGRGPY